MENNNFDEKINNEAPEAPAPEPNEQPAAKNIPAEEVKPEEIPAEAPIAEPVEEVKPEEAPAEIPAAEPVEEVKPEEPAAEAPKEKPERITSIPKYEPKTYVRESAPEPTYDAPVQDSDDRLEGVSDSGVKTEQGGNKNKTWIIIAVVAIVLLLLAACCSVTVLRGIIKSFMSRTLV